MNKTRGVKQRLRKTQMLAILFVMTVLLSIVFAAGTAMAAPPGDYDYVTVLLDDTFSEAPPLISGYTYIGWTFNGGELLPGTPRYTPVRGMSEDVIIAYVYKKTPTPPKSGE
ncbi:MAG: hypothetical protein FWG14_07505 [Peptococcaceae bacterium]|nr:hypothetical protein [Peptococcaceae bacterium]